MTSITLTTEHGAALIIPLGRLIMAEESHGGRHLTMLTLVEQNHVLVRETCAEIRHRLERAEAEMGGVLLMRSTAPERAPET